MKFKAIILIIALAAVLFGAFPAAADECAFENEIAVQCSGLAYRGFEYAELTNNTVEITGYIGGNEEIQIPSSIGGKTVAYIGQNAFRSCSTIKRVMFPNTVTAIGKWAFSGCYALENLDFSDNSSLSSISAYAFAGCPRLRAVTLPDSLLTIGEGAFSGCESLSSVLVPDSVVSVGEGAFYSCPRLTVVCGRNSAAHSYVSANSLRYVTAELAKKIILGDVDEDGAVTSSDAMILLRCSAGIETIGRKIMKAADADGDGALTAADALMILRLSAGL